VKACAAAAVTGSSDLHRHHKQSNRWHPAKHAYAQQIRSVSATCPCACANPCSPPATAAAGAAGADAAAYILTSGSPFPMPACSRTGSPWPTCDTRTSSPVAAPAAGAWVTGGCSSSSSCRLHSPQRPCTGLRRSLLSSPVPMVLRCPANAGAVAAGAFCSPQKHSAAVVATTCSRAAARRCAHSNPSAYNPLSEHLAGVRVGTAPSSSSKWLVQAGWQECRYEQLDQQALAAEAATLAAESQAVAAAIKCTSRLL
jgi:hypothetical protein